MVVPTYGGDLFRPADASAGPQDRALARIEDVREPPSDELAYRIIDATFLTHIDPLSAPDSAANPVPDAILTFIGEHVGDGTTSAELP